MAKYEKNHDVISALDEEAFWVTQKSGTERAGTGKYLFMSILFLASRYLPHRTNLIAAAAGPALPSRSRRTS
jgi:hypothetical protein